MSWRHVRWSGGPTRSRLMVALAMVISLSMPVVAPGVAQADCGDTGPVVRVPADASGTTFIGVFERAHLPEVGARMTWTVERVFAGDIKRGRLSFLSTECDWLILREGQRYLFSTGAEIPRRRATFADSIAWAVDGDRVALEGFRYPTADTQYLTTPDEYPAGVRRVTTVRQALDLVVPELPPTDSAPATHPGSSWWQPLLRVVSAIMEAIAAALQ